MLALLVFCLGILAYYSLQLPEVQTSITQRGTEWLSEKLGGNVTVSQVRISWLDEITFEDVNIKDLKGRDMIFVREIYVNCKTNFSFDPAKIIRFDNNLDYVLLKSPEVKIVREKNGALNIDYWIAKVQDIGRDPKKPRIADHNLPFTIDNAYVKNGMVSLEDNRRPLMPDELFDYYNFRFDNINGNLENVLILGDTVSFKAKSINAADKRSKLVVKDIKTDFLYCKTAMTLDKLSAYINESYVGDRLHLYYDRPSAFNDFFNKVRMDADIKHAVLNSKDLGRFSSNMYQYDERYLLDARMKGKYVDLTFEDFKLKWGKTSNLNGTANFKGFPDLKKTFTKLDLKASTMDWQDVSQYSQNADFQKYIRKIDQLALSGTFEGLYNDFKSKPLLVSEQLGKISGEVNVKITDQSEQSTYFGDLDVNSFDLGKLFDQEIVQKLTFAGKIKGKGLKIDDASVELDGIVSEIGYNNYNYHNITVDGKLGQSIFDGYLEINDPNLVAEVEGMVDFNKDLNTFKIKGLLDNANLKPLGFTKDDFQVQSTINFDFIGNKLDDWIGRARFLDTKIKKDNKEFAVDSMYFNSGIFENQRRFSMVTEFFNFYVNGDFVPSTLINDVNTLVKEYLLYFNETETERNKYYLTKNIKSEKDNYEANYRLYFKDSKRFFGFFYPDVYVSPGSLLNGLLTSRATTEMSLEGQVDTLIYKKNEFYNNQLDFSTSKYSSTPKVLTSYIIRSASQKMANGLKTQNIQANAYWGEANDIDFDVSIEQADNRSYAEVFGNVTFTPQGFDIRLNPKNSKVVLIDNKWTLSDKNQIRVFKDKITISDLRLSNKNQMVSANGILAKDPDLESIFVLRDFDLMTLKPFTNVELRGRANGELRLKDFYKNTYFTSNLHIEDLEYRKSKLGTITTEAVWDALDDKLKINGNIFRDMNEVVRISGYYDPAERINPLSLKGRVRNLNLNVFEGMVEGIFNKIGGLAEGDLEITGSPLDPVFKGAINIKNGSMNVVASGTTLYFDDTIILNEEGFVAGPEGITVRDAPVGGNIATIEGGVFNGGSGEFMVGLHAYVKGNTGFKVLNLKPYENNVMYGTAFATGDVHLSGDFDNVNITGNLVSNKGTKITIPMDGGKVIDTKQEGIPFVKRNVEDDTLARSQNKKPKIKTGGINMAFNLSFTPDAECEIIFDRANNDVLDVYGEGRLSILYDTRGEFTINGPYTVRSGKYNFSFQNVASLRRFNIVDGSTITWSGDPYEANLDMRANYTANIPIPSSISPELANTSTRYPVNVSVLLTNRLLTPTIKYDVNFDFKQIPLIGQSQTQLLGFEQKLRNDEQLLSRNVSSILVFNEVFPDNLTDAISQQFLIDNVSNMLSNQIGNLANKLNPNLELGVQFGNFRENILNNMQFNFSYRFLDNRIKLSGKSAFINSLESSINAANTGQLSVGGELEYLLSADGEYKFRLFSRSVPANFYTFNSAGNVVVSGGSLIISRNFNSIFTNKKPKPFPLGVGKKEDLSLNIEKASDSTLSK